MTGQYRGQVDKAIAAGRLTPAQATGLVAFMLTLPDDVASHFTFTRPQGGAQTEEIKQSPAQFFIGFLPGLGKQLDFGIDQGGQASAPDDTGMASFALALTARRWLMTSVWPCIAERWRISVSILTPNTSRPLRPWSDDHE